MVGQTISHYRITEKLGEGGMGVVYKAEDTSLDRPVALKFLAPHLVQDTEIRKRFEREAKAAAALNHPNVCTVYEIAEAQGRTFIAMAFLEGESLDKKIEAGPLKLKEALDIAIQTAHGLQAAHEKKIVHRDIKPANLMIGEDGHVTIMDFGLALLTDRSKLTRMDETMGTVTYMSPEQTYGMDVDRRTDVWSLGVVIYEMVTGQQPFKGHYDKAVMYSITNEEPEPMTGLRTGVPMELELLVNKCLAKERDRRYQSTADMVVDLETLSDKLKSGKSTIIKPQAGSQTIVTQSVDVVATPADHPLVRYRVIENLDEQNDSVIYRAEDTQLNRSVTINVLPESATRGVERRQRLKDRLLITMAVLFTVALAAILVMWLSGPGPAQPGLVSRFSFTPDSIDAGPFGRAMISPNGRHIVYIGGDGPALWVRDIDHEEPRELGGTEGARPQGIFWSPDSQFIGFATGNELKKVSVQGGPTVTLCQLPGTIWEGGTWSPDGSSIVFSSGDPPPVLHEVPSRGGEPKLLFEPEQTGKGNGNHRPHFLPTSRMPALLYSVGSFSDREIIVKDLETGERKVLTEGAHATYSPTGHVVYQTNATIPGLWALPFSLETVRPTGEAFPIAENVGDPSVAGDGTLVYVDFGGGVEQQLVWYDRRGTRLDEMIGQPQGRTAGLALSPDGSRVAVRNREGRNEDIWVHEVHRSLKRRLTFDEAQDARPVWAPSGREITFRSKRQGSGDIYIKPVDGTGKASLLFGTALRESPEDWSANGKYLLYEVQQPETGNDISYLKRKDDGSSFESIPFLQSSFSETQARFSPDGHYVAYVSNESGRREVYVVPFPKAEGKQQLSANGGLYPRWSKNGAELFYVEDRTLMSVAVATTPGFTFGNVTPLFPHESLRQSVNNSVYDVSADGKRFVLRETIGDEETKALAVHFVRNWFADFKDRQQD